MKIEFSDYLKLGVVFAALLVSSALFYRYVIYYPQRERAHQASEDLKSAAKQEQERREYIAKRKKDCYDMYERERKQWNNVESFSYIEPSNVAPSDEIPSFGVLSLEERIQEGLDLDFSAFRQMPPSAGDVCEIIYTDKKDGDHFRKYY